MAQPAAIQPIAGLFAAGGRFSFMTARGSMAMEKQGSLLFARKRERAKARNPDRERNGRHVCPPMLGLILLSLRVFALSCFRAKRRLLAIPAFVAATQRVIGVGPF